MAVRMYNVRRYDAMRQSLRRSGKERGSRASEPKKKVPRWLVEHDEMYSQRHCLLFLIGLSLDYFEVLALLLFPISNT
ncbi:hypothetical protein ASPWEDRAFT_34364 [Aspergillus wentii DTO 134E9]|uniref:Uncharacterized protein n=1 Tax=Aspergillus wentii DTO 134E9 TaxID=1073089 RepID=A0A1L9S163_ASPWE|nr:uncharacterized protein ASPWEDRAFT_34364 [Aspergillus wentii DTO 134E9]OJJ40896.1 hypothetical protein ASPWEDRAFT_34364 [Aspergillus wentii DTO 134E9]